jgi:enoyl-CoA hydratase/carnithine racemase
MPTMQEGPLMQETGLSTDDLRVLLDAVSHVGTIEIRRPPNNFFDGDVLAQAVDAARRLGDMGARALVLCSEGKNFCAGANFGGGPGGAAGGGRSDIYELGIELLEQPLPIVAAVQGGAVGGGVGLALVADLRVAAPESYFWVNFARLGIHHGFGLSVTLPLAVGHQRAIELLYTGRRLGGEDAHRAGLCDHLVPAARVRERATELAAEIAAAAPLATRAIRQTMRGSLAADVKVAMATERAIQDQLIRTEDFREGTSAVRERREPQFRAR